MPVATTMLPEMAESRYTNKDSIRNVGPSSVLTTKGTSTEIIKYVLQWKSVKVRQDIPNRKQCRMSKYGSANVLISDSGPVCHGLP